MGKIVRTQLRIPKTIYDDVQTYSKKECISMNLALVGLIEQGFRKAPPPAKVSEALELITNAIGNQHE